MSTKFPGRDESRSGLLLILLAGTLWGTVGITSKVLYGLSAATPLSVGFFRLALATPVLLLACRLALGSRMLAVPRRDLAVMCLMGGLTALYQVFYFAAVKAIGVAAATLITLCSAPVIVAAASGMLLGERLNRSVAFALVCALGGTALLVGGQPGTSAEGALLYGVLPALGSACSYAAVTLIGRTLAGRYHPLQPIAIGFTTGALLLLPVALADGLVVVYPAGGWALLVYLGVVPTALAYGLFIAGLSRTTATTASICTLMEPLVSTCLAWLLFAERFNLLGALGALLLAGALALLYLCGGRTRPAASPQQA